MILLLLGPLYMTNMFTNNLTFLFCCQFWSHLLLWREDKITRHWKSKIKWTNLPNKPVLLCQILWRGLWCSRKKALIPSYVTPVVDLKCIWMYFLNHNQFDPKYILSCLVLCTLGLKKLSSPLLPAGPRSVHAHG